MTSEPPAESTATSHERRTVDGVTIGLLVICLTALTTGPVHVFSVRVLGAQATWEANEIKIGFMIASALGAVAFALRAATGRLRRPGVGVILGAAFTALAIISTTWSVLPSQTLWRSLTYVGMLLAAWCLTSLRFGQVLVVLIGFSGIGVLGSWAAVVLRPDVGRAENGAWRGIYTSPNSLGPVCAVLVIGLAGWAIRRRDTTVFAAAGFGMLVALVPLYRSASETAMIALVVGVAVATTVTATSRLWRNGQRRPAAGVLGGAAAAAAIAVAAVGGRVWNAPSLAQRREVWGLVRERIADRPWDGYGFFTYWETYWGQTPRLLARVGSAHNSVLEAALGVGIVGSVLIGALLVVALVRNLVLAVRLASPESWMALTLAVFLVLEHSTESFVSWFSYLWILLIVVTDLIPARATRDRVAGSSDD